MNNGYDNDEGDGTGRGRLPRCYRTLLAMHPVAGARLRGHDVCRLVGLSRDAGPPVVAGRYADHETDSRQVLGVRNPRTNRHGIVRVAEVGLGQNPRQQV